VPSRRDGTGALWTDQSLLVGVIEYRILHRGAWAKVSYAIDEDECTAWLAEVNSNVQR
jgi:hypothetical protein